MQLTLAAWGRTAALVASAALVLIGAGDAAPRRADPLVIAISGVKAPELRGSEVAARLAVIDSLIDARVRAQGFSVVPRDSTNALMTRLADSIGVYDPISGARDTARIRIVEQTMRRGVPRR